MHLNHAALTGLQGAIAVGVAGLFSAFTVLVPTDPQGRLTGSLLAPSPAIGRELLPTPQQPPTADVQDAAETSDDEATLRRKVELLQQGREFVQSAGAYTATMLKQEEVQGERLDEQEVFLKCRQSPFSVYLRWDGGDAGREVLYVEGRDDGKLLGHDGGWKARLPSLTLDPECSLAMRDTRYPVTQAGLVALIDLMTDVHEEDLQTGRFAKCEYGDDSDFDGRPCHAFTTVYTSAETSPDYRKSVTLIDQEWNVPVSTQHYGWPAEGQQIADDELDAATLIESYQFTDVNFEAQITEADFDPEHEDYKFR